MTTSILTSIKKLLGLAAEDTSFDVDVIMHINDAFMTLRDLGVGPEEGFRINSDIEAWDMFINDSQIFEDVKTYVYKKTKLGFDPPLSGTTVQMMERQIAETEWRLNARSDKG